MGRLSLNGAVVLITGAGNGIGLALAQEARERGATVVAVDLDQAGLDRLSQDAVGVIPYVANVTDAKAMAAIVQSTLDQFGKLDVVIANAGIERIEVMSRMPPKDFERVIEVNVLGVYRTLQPCLAPIIASGGHLLAVSSIAGLLPFPLGAAYSSSKAAVDMMMRVLRMELLGTNATAGAAYFGFVSSDMGERVTGHPGVQALSRWMPKRVLGLEPYLSTEFTARRVLDGIEARRARIYAPSTIRLTYALRGLFAQSDDFLGKWVMRLPDFIGKQ